MAQKKNDGCLGPFLVMIFVVVVGIYVLFLNIVNFKIMVSHNPSQYIWNIVHFHKDLYCQSKYTTSIYKKVSPVSELTPQKSIATLNTGNVFKLKGYIGKENVTWIAIKAFKGNEVLYGYIMTPEKVSVSTFWKAFQSSGSYQDEGNTINNQYFRQIYNKEIDEFHTKMLNAFKNDVRKSIKVLSETGGINIQKVRESKEFKIIESMSDKNEIIYCDKKDFETVEALYDNYLGSNFETHYLQTNKFYYSKKEGVFNESFVMKFIGSRYFKWGIPASFFVGFFFLLYIMGKDKCPKCGSTKIIELQKIIIDQKYKHETKSGGRDKRYSNNPLISTVRVNKKCTSCDHEWTITFKE